MAEKLTNILHTKVQLLSASPSNTVSRLQYLKEGLFEYTVHRKRHEGSKEQSFVGVLFSKTRIVDFVCLNYVMFVEIVCNVFCQSSNANIHIFFIL